MSIISFSIIIILSPPTYCYQKLTPTHKKGNRSAFNTAINPQFPLNSAKVCQRGKFNQIYFWQRYRKKWIYDIKTKWYFSYEKDWSLHIVTTTNDGYRESQFDLIIYGFLWLTMIEWNGLTESVNEIYSILMRFILVIRYLIKNCLKRRYTMT